MEDTIDYRVETQHTCWANIGPVDVNNLFELPVHKENEAIIRKLFIRRLKDKFSTTYNGPMHSGLITLNVLMSTRFRDDDAYLKTIGFLFNRDSAKRLPALMDAVQVALRGLAFSHTEQVVGMQCFRIKSVEPFVKVVIQHVIPVEGAKIIDTVNLVSVTPDVVVETNNDE